MDFDERYRAVASRDARFDGQFVTAVHTTGIYCRPSCPARTPKPGNVSFYPTSAAAHEAGYRACKRCLPEAAPGSPEWDLRGDTAARAMRLIADGVVERDGVPGLAARLGYSGRHLSRLLAAELGAGPLALARAHRAQTARTLLVGTELPVAEVAFSAGFASVRQFNDTVREVFGVTPSELRARRRRVDAVTPHAAVSTRGAISRIVPQMDDGGSPRTVTTAPRGDPAVAIRLALPYRAPFDAAGLFAWMQARAVDGVEEATASSFARTIRLPRGAAWFRIRMESPPDASAHRGAPRAEARAPGGPGTIRSAQIGSPPGGSVPDGSPESSGRLLLEAHLQQLADLGALVARVRRLFDLDADPVAVDAALSAHRELAPLVTAVPGIRVPGAADPHEMLIRAMVGQQISVTAARTHLTRLADVLGERVDIAGRARVLFPTMEAIAERGARTDAGGSHNADDPAGHTPGPLRGPSSRIRAITGAAAALEDGSLALTSADDGPSQREALLAMPGIGPWTADYVRMRVLSDPDVLLPGDLALRAGAAAARIPADPRPLTRWAGRVAPWRSYLSAHLWRAALTPPAEIAPETVSMQRAGER